MVVVPRQILLSALVVLGLLLGLAGCRSAPEGPVAIGTNTWIGYEPGYVAEMKGLFGEAEVNLRQFQSASETLRAFRNQSIDVAAVTLDEALMLAQRGTQLRIILVTDISHGADAILARPEIRRMTDLKGRRIGVEDSTLGAYVLARAMQMHGLDETAVRQVPLTVDEAAEVYRQGKVDAVVTFEPYKTQLLNLGAVKVFDSSEIPEEIVDVLIVREEFARDHPNALRSVVAGWLTATQLVNRRDPAALSGIAKRLGLSHAQLVTALQELRIPTAVQNLELLDNSGGQIAVTARKLQPLLEKRNGIRFRVSTASLVTTEFLPGSTGR